MKWWRRRRSNEDLADEIQSHLDLETDRLIAEGLNPEEARATAKRRFGPVTPVQEWFHESHRVLWFDHLAQDLKAAARSVAKYPISCFVAVISLAGGIGATTATLTIRDVIFRRPPLHYQSPEQLSVVQLVSSTRSGSSALGAFAPGMSLIPGTLYSAWHDTIAADTLATMAAAAPERTSSARIGDRTLDTVRVRAVTPEFFATLGVRAVVGSTFDQLAQQAGGPAPAILSYRLWDALFDKQPNAIGQQIWIGDEALTIVGVLPDRFWFSSMVSPVWTRLDHTRSQAALEVIARRQPAVTGTQLAGQLQTALDQYISQLPANERGMRLRMDTVYGTPTGRSVALALPYVLGVAVLLTLLIACANVAILVIAQWTAREHEIAIRASLGASRGRIARLLVTESVLIAVVGGVLGVASTFAIRGVIIRNAGPQVGFFDLRIDPYTLFEVGIITLLTGIVAGIGPALLETRRLLGNPLRAIATSDRVKQRWRHGLVVMEISVTVALLVVTSSMLSGYRRGLTMDLGFNTHPLIRVNVVNAGGVPTTSVIDTLKQLPGVAGASASTSIPYAANGPMKAIATDATNTRSLSAELGTITPEFFDTLDVRMRTGRAFTQSDTIVPQTIILNETLATRLMPGRDTLGSTVWIGSKTYEVVGVVATYRNMALQPEERLLKAFVPLGSSEPRAKQQSFLIRVNGDAPRMVRDVRQAIADAAAGNTIGNAATVDQIIDVGSQEMLDGTAPLAPLIAIGLFLTSAGIYGVLAFAIARRTKELAVRAAVGASGAQLARLVLGHSIVLVAMGAGVGIAVTFALSRVVRANGGAGSIYDPTWTSFVIPLLVVGVIGLVATWIPARRAMRVNPSILLRTT